MSLDLIWKIAGTIFGAGILFAVVRQMRVDLKGVSTRGRREAEVANFRFLTEVISTLIYTADIEERKAKGKMYLEAGFPEGRR